MYYIIEKETGKTIYSEDDLEEAYNALGAVNAENGTHKNQVYDIVDETGASCFNENLY